MAVGLYAAFYYVGGGLGAAIPGYFWDLGGWPACVAFIACVQILTVDRADLLEGPGAGRGDDSDINTSYGQAPLAFAILVLYS